jgi:hypothetical protein
MVRRLIWVGSGKINFDDQALLGAELVPSGLF